MKTYCITSTINVFVNAENLDEAHDIFGDIDIKFTDRRLNEAVEFHFIDTDIHEVEVEPFNEDKRFHITEHAIRYCHQYDNPVQCIRELALRNIDIGEYGFASELLQSIR